MCTFFIIKMVEFLLFKPGYVMHAFQLNILNVSQKCQLRSMVLEMYSMGLPIFRKTTSHWAISHFQNPCLFFTLFLQDVKINHSIFEWKYVVFESLGSFHKNLFYLPMTRLCKISFWIMVCFPREMKFSKRVCVKCTVRHGKSPKILTLR